jgi:NAD(P)-dependent dehydrogenase (short-subunit alcohol dehydrogenase family)
MDMSGKKSILITGASTGIGYAATRAFQDAGWLVFPTVRNAADAERLATEIPGAEVLICDVTDRPSLAAARDRVRTVLGGRNLSVLLNNAGIAVGGPLQLQDMKLYRRHFEVNVFGLVQTTQVFLPLLGAEPNNTGRPGRIINITSIGGKVAAPFISAYVGTKHAVEGISHSLRRELKLYGVDVIIVGPGSIKTPIWDKGADFESYRDTPYEPVLERLGRAFVKAGKEGLEPDYLADRLVRIAEKRKPRARYAVVPNRLANWTIPRRLPHRWLDWVVYKTLLRR